METVKEWADRTFVKVTWCDRLERMPSDYGIPQIIGLNKMPTEEEREEALEYRLNNDNVPL